MTSGYVCGRALGPQPRYPQFESQSWQAPFEYEFLTIILAKKNSSFIFRWIIDTDQPLVLHVKPLLRKLQVFGPTAFL